MTKQQLEVFTHLADSLNYSETASRMNLSQPGVSYQINRLEEELGIRLFERNTRRVELSAAGKVFCGECKEIVRRLDNAILMAQNTDRQIESVLSVGCMSWSAFPMDRILRRFHAKMPKVQLIMFQAEPNSVHSRFQRDECSVAISTFAETEEFLKGVSFKAVYKSHFVCAVPSDHPFASKSMLNLDEMDGEKLLFLDSAKAPLEMLSIQNTIRNNSPRSILYYSDSPEISMCMASAGLGILIVPDFIYTPDNIVKVPLDYPAGPVIGVCWKTETENDTVRTFINCVENEFGVNFPQ